MNNILFITPGHSFDNVFYLNERNELFLYGDIHVYCPNHENNSKKYKN